jgi:3-oxoacyl-[acyl-carrier-protein] synthase-3
MQFKNVVIQSLAAIDAPIKITSTQIAERLRPAMERLGIRQDLLENISGIGARRVWDHGTQPSDATTSNPQQHAWCTATSACTNAA